MSILLITSDLMIQSRVASSAAQAGLAAPKVLAAKDLMAAKPDQEASYGLAVLDLSAPGIEVPQTVATLRQQFPAAQIIAFAPHVHTAKLEAARAAGCDQVLSRGQFDGEMDAIAANTAARFS